MKRIFGVLFIISFYAFVFPVKTFSQTAYAIWDGTTLKFEYDGANTYDPNNMAPHTWIIPEEVGEMPGWLNEAKNAESVEFTSSFADARPKRCFDWFFGFEYLEDIIGMQYLNTSETIDMQGMFYGCKNLQSIDLRNFETGSVTMMNLMFGDCSSLTSLDLSSFYTWSVNSMHGMFSGCSNLSNIKFGNNFNTNGVEDMSSMFSGCSSLKRLDISWFRTNSLKYLRSMFSGCNSLEIIDLNNFTTPAAQDMNNMFSGCSSLKRLDLHGFNISHVSSTKEMFENCESLEKIICDGDWSGVSESTNMFSGCTNLAGAISYNSSKVTAAYANKTTGYFSQFYYYIAEVSNDHNTLTFRRSETAPNGTTQWDATRSGFEDDIWDPYQKDDDYYEPKYTFHGLGVKKVVFDESFKDARPNSCYEWFYENWDLEEIEGIEYLNTSETISISEMFNSCTGLKSIDLRNFVLSENIEDISMMFYGCSNLETIICDDDWSVINCLSDGMFTDCLKLKGAISYNYSKHNKNYANPSTGYFTSSANYKVDLTVPSYGICTYSSTSDLDFTNVEGLTAYVISDFNAGEGTLTLTPATTVKAGEGLLLKGDAGEYIIPRTTTDATYTNYLVGVPTTTSVSPTDGDYTNFILANGSHGINFYVLSKTGNIAAGKAYLQLPTAALNQMSLSKGFSIIGGLTSITNVEIEKNNSKIFYDLQGRRVEKPTKGLYIVNGKKVIIK